MKLAPEILTQINVFLEGEIPQCGTVECVVLCGSYATGKATCRSDIDLCFIGVFPDFRSETKTFRKRDYHLMMAPWSWYQHVVSEYERKGNVGTITVMLANGTCVSGDSDKWRSLHELARHYYEIGPIPPSGEEIRRHLTRIRGLWNNYCDSIDPLTRKWLYLCILKECVTAHFVLRCWWAVKPKYQLEELRVRDGVMANMVQVCLESSPSLPDDVGNKTLSEVETSYLLMLIYDKIWSWISNGFCRFEKWPTCSD